MIKDRNTGDLRDFAFVEYFTLEDANKVLQISRSKDILVLGQCVHITYSKVKRGEMPVVNYNI